MLRRKLRLALRHPELVGRKVNAFLNRRFGTREYNHAGVDIFAEDWDNLLLLDACRADIFEEIALPALDDLDGRYTTRESRGSATPEFLYGNLHDRDRTDTVYVTGNPQVHWQSDRIETRLHATVHVWREDDGWNERYGTVLPGTMTEYALRAAERYPEKRLLVHYMQPHYPFITDETAFDKGHLDAEDGEDPFHMWMQLTLGRLDLSPSAVRSLFADNLERTIPALREAIEALPGRTVVTADHGNMHGERSSPIPVREWGHPAGIYAPELVEVPWLAFGADERRTVVAEPPVEEQATVDDEVVGERLRQLGYAG